MIKVNKMDRVVINLNQENDAKATKVEFDYSEWYEKYGSGTISLIYRRHGDSESYPVVLATNSDHVATWTVSATDTAKKGHGAVQLMYQVGDDVKVHSAVASTVVRGSNYDVGDVPEGYDNWLATLTTLSGTVTTKASEASASAQTASTKASEASTSASNALSAKNDAV